MKRNRNQIKRYRLFLGYAIGSYASAGGKKNYTGTLAIKGAPKVKT